MDITYNIVNQVAHIRDDRWDEFCNRALEFGYKKSNGSYVKTINWRKRIKISGSDHLITKDEISNVFSKKRKWCEVAMSSTNLSFDDIPDISLAGFVVKEEVILNG